MARPDPLACYDERARISDMRFEAMLAKFDRIEQGVRDLNRSIRRLRWVVIAAGILEVVIVVGGVALFNTVILPRILAAHRPSKEVIEFEARMRRQHAQSAAINAQSAAMLDEIRQQLRSRPPNQ